MRIAIGLSYEGSRFEGWQSQASGNTVQDHLELALAEVAGTPVRVNAAGRTDAGVHALAQVAHFDTDSLRPDNAWVRGTNAHLPPEIAVQWAMPVDAAFHSRFSAQARSYRYLLYNHPVRPALLSRHVGWFYAPLDVAAMRAAAACLVGEHDFSAFRSSECQADSPVRTIEDVRISAAGPYLLFDITANGFLHHMVRNIVGSLVYVGKGRHGAEWLGGLLAARDRRDAAPTFSPAGLYLAAVRYPAQWRLPAFARMMDFFPRVPGEQGVGGEYTDGVRTGREGA
jgi:tRNA pseudouridine38-40 synthase